MSNLINKVQFCIFFLFLFVCARQEAQRENAFLRAQFAERSDSFAQEKLEADRRLGAVEVETQRLSESLKESAEKHAEELKKQEERVSTAQTLQALQVVSHGVQYKCVCAL